MNEKFAKQIKWWGITLFFGTVILITIFQTFINPAKLEQHFRIGIAEIYLIEGSDGGPLANFYYYVNTKKYSGFTYANIDTLRLKVRQRYFIKYYPLDPSNADIIIESPVPDSIKSAPSNGWPTEPWLRKVVVEGVVQSLGKNDWVKVCIKLGDLELCEGGVNKDFNESDIGKKAYVRYSTVDSSVPWEVFKVRPTE